MKASKNKIKLMESQVPRANLDLSAQQQFIKGGKEYSPLNGKTEQVQANISSYGMYIQNNTSSNHPKPRSNSSSRTGGQDNLISTVSCIQKDANHKLAEHRRNTLFVNYQTDGDTNITQKIDGENVCFPTNKNENNNIINNLIESGAKKIFQSEVNTEREQTDDFLSDNQIHNVNSQGEIKSQRGSNYTCHTLQQNFSDINLSSRTKSQVQIHLGSQVTNLSNNPKTNEDILQTQSTPNHSQGPGEVGNALILPNSQQFSATYQNTQLNPPNSIFCIPNRSGSSSQLHSQNSQQSLRIGNISQTGKSLFQSQKKEDALPHLIEQLYKCFQLSNYKEVIKILESQNLHFQDIMVCKDKLNDNTMLHSLAQRQDSTGFLKYLEKRDTYFDFDIKNAYRQTPLMLSCSKQAYLREITDN